MSLTPAYAVNGGRVPAELLRMTLWATTSGATGVVGSGDLKVTALSVPGTSVNIAPGGAIMANRFTGASRTQSYAAANDATVQFPIPATGAGGGRTDYIILKIEDWHYDGSPAPADPVDALYCSFQRVSSLSGLNYPFVPLAKITLPANTGTITNAMITDIRDIALPRQRRFLRVQNPTAKQTETLKATNAIGEYFPNSGFIQSIDCPSWATHAIVRADWIQLWLPAGNATGNLWVEFGPWDAGAGRPKYRTEKFAYNNPNAGDMRQTATAASTVYIYPELRGTAFNWILYGQKTAGTGAKIDSMTGISLDVLFVENVE